MTEFGSMLAGLDQAGVRFVVIGGVAVIGHGVVRATKDLDVVVGTDAEAAETIGAAMSDWAATRPDGSAEPRTVPSAGWPLHLRTPHGLLDLLAEGHPPLDLEGLLARATLRRIDGVTAPLRSLADLVALKRRAGRERNLADLADLAAAHGELPEPPTR